MTHTNVRSHYRRLRRGKVAKIRHHIRKVKDYIKGGLAKGKPDSKYDKRQLAMGRKVELEHTDDPKIANEIAKDHLEEFPNYYTELAKTEKRLERQKKKRYGIFPQLLNTGLYYTHEEGKPRPYKTEHVYEWATPLNKRALELNAPPGLKSRIKLAKPGDIFKETYKFKGQFKTPNSSEPIEGTEEVVLSDVEIMKKPVGMRGIRETMEFDSDIEMLEKSKPGKITYKLGLQGPREREMIHKGHPVVVFGESAKSESSPVIRELLEKGDDVTRTVKKKDVEEAYY